MRRTFRIFLPLVLTVATALVLAISACDDDDHDIGRYCESDGECMTGMCYRNDGANYCTLRCDDEGARNQCPEFTVCKRIHGGPHRCLLTCERDADCPRDSDCENVKNSGLRACEPND
jgi:hypothetical protein